MVYIKHLSRLIVAIFFLFTMPNLAHAIDITSITGSLSTDLKNDPYIDITVTIEEIPDTQKQLGDGEARLSNRIEIVLPKSSNTKIARAETSTDTDYDNKFYWDKDNIEPTISNQGIDDNVFVYTIRIKESPDNDSKTLESLIEKDSTSGESGINVKVLYYSYDGNGGYSGSPRDRTELIAQIFDVPSVAPSDFDAVGAHKSVNLTWTKADTVRYTDGNERKPGGVLEIILKNNNEEIDLSSAAKISSGDANTDSQGTCRYIPDANQGANCIECTDDNTYLDADALKKISGAENSRLVTDAGKDRFSDVEDEQIYTIALQYKDGTQRTVCLNVTSNNNRMMSEYYGEESKSSDPRCFIATAAFGSIFDKRIEIFRWFRDQILLQFPLGRKAVRIYYKLSPSLADTIRIQPFLKTIVKIILVPIGLFLSLIRYFYEDSTLMFTAMMLIFLFGLKYNTKRKKHA
ncbi:MAG: CFI-box-CTERM domain-containing protein [Bdellovibrionota bacterium]